MGKWAEQKGRSGVTKQHRRIQYREECKNRRKRRKYQIEKAKQRQFTNSNQRRQATVQDRSDGAAGSREIEKPAGARDDKERPTAQTECSRANKDQKASTKKRGDSRKTAKAHGKLRGAGSL